MAKRKNMENVVDQAVSLEEEVLQKNREIVHLTRECRRLERVNIRVIHEQAEAAVENDARVLKYKVATILSTAVAVVMVFVNII